MSNYTYRTYTISIFISSFLLFSLEPFFAKYLLPLYGGQANIWISLMTFYMGIVSLGYLYVYLLSYMKLSIQLTIHKILSITTFISIIIHYFTYKSFILPLNSINSFVNQTPVISIILVATIHIGLPFFILTTTSTLLQSWQTYSKNKKSPYSLYSVSNIGALSALILYPFLVEPLLSLQSQALVWSILFTIFIFLILKIIYKNEILFEKLSIRHIISNSSIKFKKNLIWLSLSILSTVTLISTTSYISQSISPTPFIWLIPLALYLLSFVIAFSGLNWYSPISHLSLLLILLIASTLGYTEILHLSYPVTLILSLSTMFLLCFVAHSSLYDNKPNSIFLTKYYFIISLGSVIGSIFCSFVAPVIFNSYLEFPLSLLAGSILCLFLFLNANLPKIQKIQFLIISAFSFVVVFALINPNLFNNFKSSEYVLTEQRNFFGVIKIISNAGPNNFIYRVLYNGKIMHGTEDIVPGLNPEPTTYYTRDSGLGLSILNHPKRLMEPIRPISIGIIGLGVGTVAAYCKTGDYFHFYEINPQVISVSKTYFTYLSYCQDIGGKVDISEGDARLVLAKESPNNYDIIVIDAFTDDAIPMHLITEEAVKLYLNNITKSGLLAFHISNANLDLTPVLINYAKTYSLYAHVVKNNQSHWVILSNDPISFGDKLDLSNRSVRWTDNFSNLFSVLK